MKIDFEDGTDTSISTTIAQTKPADPNVLGASDFDIDDLLDEYDLTPQTELKKDPTPQKNTAKKPKTKQDQTPLTDLDSTKTISTQPKPNKAIRTPASLALSLGMSLKELYEVLQDPHHPQYADITTDFLQLVDRWESALIALDSKQAQIAYRYLSIYLKPLIASTEGMDNDRRVELDIHIAPTKSKESDTAVEDLIGGI